MFGMQNGVCAHRISVNAGGSARHSDAQIKGRIAGQTPAPMGNSKVLQALRALSALAVVLFHANHSFFGNARYWVDLPFGRTMEFGHAGVEFFFVLSGFIICAAHRNDIGNPSRLGQFAWKRFRRVYPVYWIMLAMILPVYFLVPSFGSGSELLPGRVVDSVLLLHLFDDGQILTVSWTLFHEIAFYAVFSVMILSRRFGVATIAAWSVASAVSLVEPTAVPPALTFILSPLHILFGMGMVAAWLVGRGRVALPGLLLACGVAVFCATAADDVWEHHLAIGMLSVFYGLGSSLILLGAVELERRGKLPVPRILTFLGDASYSVYLVHFVAMSVLAKVALAVMSRVHVPHAMTYVALVAASIGAGLVFHLFVELPLVSLLGQVRFGVKRVPQPSGSVPAALQSGAVG